jgi:hypothetical protein
MEVEVEKGGGADEPARQKYVIPAQREQQWVTTAAPKNCNMNYIVQKNDEFGEERIFDPKILYLVFFPHFDVTFFCPYFIN